MIKNIIKRILENKFVDYFLIFLIIFNIICLGFETDKTIYLTYKTFFSKVELVSVIIFTIEYLMRLFTLNKLRDMFQPLMIIDLLAILPFYLPLSRLDLRILRIFRLLVSMLINKIYLYDDKMTIVFNTQSSPVEVSADLIKKAESSFLPSNSPILIREGLMPSLFCVLRTASRG